MTYTVVIYTKETIENERLLEIFREPIVKCLNSDRKQGRGGRTWFVWETIINGNWATVGEFQNKDDAVLFQLSWPS